MFARYFIMLNRIVMQQKKETIVKPKVDIDKIRKDREKIVHDQKPVKK